MQLAPGDPASQMMDPSLSIADQEQLRSNLGLDKPIPVQYLLWLKQVVQGNLGYSTQTKQPVLQMIADRLPATLILSISSLILILLITLPLGVFSAAKKDSIWDLSITLFTFIGLSLPIFWVGLMLIMGFSLTLDLFPTSGYLSPMLQNAPWWRQALDIAYHAVLPLIAILIGGLAGLTRYHRLGMISVLGQDYILAAKSRGIRDKVILYKHALKNAALPIVTILGLSLPELVGGAFVIEYIFSWPGMGQMGVNAVFARDYPVLMGTLLMSSILIIVGNTSADLVYQKLDPRIQK
jgi:peptide/nickel transport system permease protein